MNYQAEFMTLRAARRETRKEIRRKKQQLEQLRKDPMRNNSMIIQTEAELQGAVDTLLWQDEQIKKHKKTVESLTKQMNNLELKVFYRKYMQGESLKQISKSLNYSYSHIKRVSATIKEKLHTENV
ncbi:sigma-70 family RNA polymerase sigma factor [bacterium]|nr:sigma-70 family RNA polymerase sigma factor [bacterium]